MSAKEFDLIQSAKLAMYGILVRDGKPTTVDQHLKK